MDVGLCNGGGEPIRTSSVREFDRSQEIEGNESAGWSTSITSEATTEVARRRRCKKLAVPTTATITRLQAIHG